MIDFDSEIKKCRDVRRRLEQSVDVLRSFGRIDSYRKMASASSSVHANVELARRKVEEALREVVEKEHQLRRAKTDHYMAQRLGIKRGQKERK